MKILVTGGSGFIGSHLVSGLHNRGHKVIVLSNDKSIKRKKNAIYADITNRKLMLQIIPKFDMVYHLAGLWERANLLKKHIKHLELIF